MIIVTKPRATHFVFGVTRVNNNIGGAVVGVSQLVDKLDNFGDLKEGFETTENHSIGKWIGKKARNNVVSGNGFNGTLSPLRVLTRGDREIVFSATFEVTHTRPDEHGGLLVIDEIFVFDKLNFHQNSPQTSRVLQIPPCVLWNMFFPASGIRQCVGRLFRQVRRKLDTHRRKNHGCFCTR